MAGENSPINHEREMGEITTKLDVHGVDLVRLTNSNEKRKEEIHEIQLNNERVQHIVEETNQTVNGVAENMEHLTKSVADIKKHLNKMDMRVALVEDRLFDWPKFMSGVASKQGLFIIFMVCLTIIIFTLALNAPETLPQFFDLIKSSK